MFKYESNIQRRRRAYRTTIRPVVTYGTETKNCTSDGKNFSREFERKIVKGIYAGRKVGAPKSYEPRNKKHIAGTSSGSRFKGGLQRM